MTTLVLPRLFLLPSFESVDPLIVLLQQTQPPTGSVRQAKAAIQHGRQPYRQPAFEGRARSVEDLVSLISFHFVANLASLRARAQEDSL